MCLPVILRFRESDDEFPASLQVLVDRNILEYMHYETVMFAIGHLLERVGEEMEKKQRTGCYKPLLSGRTIVAVLLHCISIIGPVDQFDYGKKYLEII